MGLLSPARPVGSLLALFAAWKCFLLAVALGAAAGSDYDSSTALFFAGRSGPDARVPALAARLTRWDALYFVQQACRGYVYEQEWAFGAGMPVLVRVVGAALPAGPATAALVAVAVAHASHLLAALALHRLTVVVSGDARLALVAAALHLVSPAGLFLSAPYAESPFAGLSFAAHLLFALGLRNTARPARRAAAVVGAGAVFGLATACRSNGLTSGALFAVGTASGLVSLAREPGPARLLALAAPVLGGLCVAAGSAVPQAVAWRRYCAGAAPGAEPRPWCLRTLPSIYGFVQAEYWNVGFLRYWTVDQLPLFLMASPMLGILLASAAHVVAKPAAGLGPLRRGPGDDHRLFVRTLAASQALVAALAITTYHVQIITRLSSGYPLWYWWLARALMDSKRQRWARAAVVFMVMYAGLQAALFASFLPPA